ncbi:MAG: hypothetical protein MUP52_09520 [Candidatus Aminicenantes bacterium]|nr:hypothetical protein [Candidatus Aminicenantes bacterium]
MMTPETFPIIEGHEPVAASGLVDTSRAVRLRNAKGVLIVVHYHANSNTNTTLTVHQGVTKALAEAGGTPISHLFPIWDVENGETTDVAARHANAASYLIDADVMTHGLVMMYIDASILTGGADWVHLGSDTGGTGLISVLYILDGYRYQQAIPLTEIA